ncbi:MAG: hypothetical protein RSB41_03975 [Bacilli bacterium]
MTNKFFIFLTTNDNKKEIYNVDIDNDRLLEIREVIDMNYNMGKDFILQVLPSLIEIDGYHLSIVFKKFVENRSTFIDGIEYNQEMFSYLYRYNEISVYSLLIDRIIDISSTEDIISNLHILENLNPTNEENIEYITEIKKCIKIKKILNINKLKSLLNKTTLKYIKSLSFKDSNQYRDYLIECIFTEYIEGTYTNNNKDTIHDYTKREEENLVKEEKVLKLK